MRIVFNGYYGQSNTGDDSFIEVAAWGAKKYWSNSESIFVSPSLPKITTKSNCTGENKFRGHQFLKLTRTIFNSDAFICAGGSTFHSLMNYKDPKKIALIKKNCFPYYKIGAIGVSIGPFNSISAELDNIRLFKRFNFLALRDTYSYEIALSYNLPYKPIKAFDLAALLPLVYNKSSNLERSDSSKTLGISLCNYESYVKDGDLAKEKTRNENIIKLLERIAHYDEDIKFKFFIFNGHPQLGDKMITEETIRKLKHKKAANIEIVDYDPSVFNTRQEIKLCDVFLSTRLHAANFACFAEIPFFLIEYHRKCRDFLTDVGYFESYRIDEICSDIENKANIILDVLNHKIEFVKPRFISDSIKRATLNFTKVNPIDL